MKPDDQIIMPDGRVLPLNGRQATDGSRPSFAEALPVLTGARARERRLKSRRDDLRGLSWDFTV